jgi:hypothetical protein
MVFLEWLDIWLVGFVVFNATFNNISALSWQSVLLVEETGKNDLHFSKPHCLFYLLFIDQAIWPKI